MPPMLPRDLSCVTFWSRVTDRPDSQQELHIAIPVDLTGQRNGGERMPFVIRDAQHDNQVDILGQLAQAGGGELITKDPRLFALRFLAEGVCSPFVEVGTQQEVSSDLENSSSSPDLFAGKAPDAFLGSRHIGLVHLQGSSKLLLIEPLSQPCRSQPCRNDFHVEIT